MIISTTVATIVSSTSNTTTRLVMTTVTRPDQTLTGPRVKGEYFATIVSRIIDTPGARNTFDGVRCHYKCTSVQHFDTGAVTDDLKRITPLMVCGIIYTHQWSITTSRWLDVVTDGVKARNTFNGVKHHLYTSVEHYHV
ncbi:hypothetical protein RRG08_045148 [Elysia crispata]|uniref:Uncharacterized protein n=1 Tax=Elysia crispata TaxID=231223 RepID=A0AAE1A3B6_9GAST|nr:hypothetical protein RRG08_045148 [Elysia crispata]